MFGHRHFQPVIQAIIKLAETAAEGALGDRAPRQGEIQGRVKEIAERSCASLFDNREAEASRDGGGCPPEGSCGTASSRQSSRSRSACRCFQEPRAGDCSWQHSADRKAHRWSRSEVDSADHGAGRRAAAHTRLCVSRAARRRHSWWLRSAPVRMSSTWTRWRARRRSASCSTTTSRPSPSVRQAASARPGGGRSARKARGAPSTRSFRRLRSSPTRSASSPRSRRAMAHHRWPPSADRRSP